MSRTFYITTPIYYPNGEPHLGHVYTTIVSDVIARYHRLAGDDTFFLTGTDEHGIKMVKTADEQKTTPAELADKNVAVFQQAWRDLGITHDDYIRTTSDRHKDAVKRIVERLVATGDIYLGNYEGWYDEGQEEFVTETEAKGREYKSAISGRPLTRYLEPTYFFKLKSYVPAVLKYIEDNPDFIRPASRRNEVISKIKQGVEDLSISRATLKWGIPMPNDPSHVLYVWIDALSNYITALGYESNDPKLFAKFWPANLHLIGKEILWFHAVYWPAMLMALKLPMPKCLFAHGWWTADGRKMSKSMGNFIDLEKVRAIVSTNGNDALRYYVLRAAPFGSDLDWSDADFNKSFVELANVVGNCLNRLLNMTAKYRNGILPAVGEADSALDDVLTTATRDFPDRLANAYENIELQQAALIPVELARAANVYIDQTAPFKLAKDPARQGRLDTVLNLSAQAIYRALVGLLPILPEKAAEGLKQLNVDVAGKTMAELLSFPLPPGHVLGTGSPLFPKIETKAS